MMAKNARWFKVIKDGQLIGVVTDQSFARYSEKGGRILICDVLDGQYAVLNDKYYRDNWLLPLNPKANAEYEEATVISIPKKEYDILSKKVETGEPISMDKLINTEPEETVIREPKVEDIATAEYVREQKLKELSAQCEQTIMNGFDLVLTDGVSHHFGMSFTDQINLINLELALDRGEEVFYHADGELDQFYSEEDARMILIAAKRWSMYNRALYNSFKNWINNIEDIDAIDKITYQSDIPEEYCTTVLQSLSDNL